MKNTRKNFKSNLVLVVILVLESNDHFGSIANSAKTIREYTSAVLEKQIKYGACASGFGSGIEAW